MNTKNIVLVTLGVIIVGGIIFFSSRSKTEAPAAPINTATSTVVIQNYQFSPSALIVKKGTTVTWTNNDGTAHTVTASKGNGPASDPIAPGKTYTYTFNTLGSFGYSCRIHPSMAGTITVTQ